MEYLSRLAKNMLLWRALEALGTAETMIRSTTPTRRR